MGAPVDKKWRIRTAGALVASLGLAVTFIAFFTAHRAEEIRVNRELEFRVGWRAADIALKLRSRRAPLHHMALHIQDSARLDDDLFSHFAQEAFGEASMALVAVNWVRWVSNTERAAFEASIGHSMLESKIKGSRTPAGVRDRYAAIVFESRFDVRPSVVGLDVAFIPAYRAALESAADSGQRQYVMTPPEREAGAPSIMVAQPVFQAGKPVDSREQRNAALLGYIFGVFRVSGVLDAAIADTPPIPERIDFFVKDGDAPDADESHPYRKVATYQPPSPTVGPAAPDNEPPVPGHEFVHTFAIDGVRWRLVSHFSQAAVSAERSTGPAVLMMCGLSLTALLTVFILTARRREARIQEMVEERTRELSATNTQLAALIKASPYAIVCLDPQQRVILWNDAAEQLFGHTGAEVLGLPFPLVVPGEEESFVARFTALAGGAVLRSIPSHRLTRDGETISTNSSAAAFYGQNRELLGVIFVIEDTRERMQVQNQLRQAQKMEAIGQLTGGLAHDFNNLLGIILGNLDLLAEKFDSGEEQELTEAAIQAAQRGAELTRQLLAFARRQPLAPKYTQLTPVLKTISTILRRMLSESVTVELKVIDGIWPVLIDVTQLESAILNLSLNARDAMPQGGRLTIEASNVVVDARVYDQNLEATPGEYVLLAVSDTGTGMTADVLAQAFEPFFTTKGSSGGSGLGLSMVHGFIKQSGGYTKIYSEVGHGTTIKIYLPRTHMEATVSEVRALSVLKGGDESILVVEDNHAIRDLAVRQLRELGYHVTEAADGAGALSQLETGADIDLLFTDVIIPDLDGRALAAMARRLRPNIKVLFTSGFTAAAASASVEEQFGSNLLSKPYRKHDLARRVRAVLDEPS